MKFVQNLTIGSEKGSEFIIAQVDDIKVVNKFNAVDLDDPLNPIALCCSTAVYAPAHKNWVIRNLGSGPNIELKGCGARDIDLPLGEYEITTN